MPADLDGAKYVSFTSYKGDGSPRSLPVWVTPFEGGYAFTTDADAFKVKRVRHDARVTIAVSNFKGVVKSDAPIYTGAAVILSGDDAARVAFLIKKKYRVTYTLITLNNVLKRIRGKDDGSGETAIKVMLAE
jgi:PPOX class probable F420-dependent enzyme